jgi:hypothetical protein
MLTAVKEAFENANNMQPAGEARVGQLETTVLTSMCAELTGGDARETAIQLFIHNFKKEDGSWREETDCDFTANGQHFDVHLKRYGYAEEWTVKLAPQGGPTECGYFTCLDCCDDPDTSLPGIEPTLRTAFELMEDNMLCPGCKQELARGKDFGICHHCARNWNTVPCSSCGNHFGDLTDGKHDHCQ